MEPNDPIKNVRLSLTCDKNFDTMTPCSTGRHCEACNKVIIDFTDKTMADYHAILEQNTKVCGHFHISQLAAVTIPNTWMSRIAATMALVVGLSVTTNTLEAQKTSHKSKIRKEPWSDGFWVGMCYTRPEPITHKGYLLREPAVELSTLWKNQLNGLLLKGHLVFPDNISGAIKIVFSLDEAGRLFDIAISESFNAEIDASILVLLTSLCLGGIEKEEDYDPNKRYAYQLDIDNGRIVA